MTFQQGVYSITSKRTTGSLPDLIGRAPIEDLSLLPKRLYALPDGVRPHYPHWVMSPKGDSLEIRALSSLVSTYRGKLAAYLLPDMAPESHWVAVPTGQDREYTIELQDHSAGWVVSDDQTPFGYTLDVKPLSGSKRDTEVFIIDRLDE